MSGSAKSAPVHQPVVLVDERPSKRPKLAVFVSGGGSNFKKIHAAILSHSIQADISASIPTLLGNDSQ